MSDFIDKYFGFWSIVKIYGWKTFIKDSIVPSVLSLFVTIAAVTYSDDSHALFDKVVNMCVSILPSYLGLLVAAYTLLLTLLTTETVAKIKEIVDDKNGLNGKDLIRTLNSDFAACVLITGFALLLSFLLSVISSLNIVFSYANVINYIGIFLMVFSLIFSIKVLVDLIEDLYNIGQSTTLL